MARPRSFDEDTVLAKAMTVFWERGYQGTSFDDLVSATGLGRGSLSGAFGDKESLFARTLEHYVKERAGRVMAMHGSGSAMTTLDTLLHGWIGMTKPDAGPCGCYLSLSGLSGDAPEFARHALLQSQRRLQGLLAAVIARGQQSGEFGQAGDPDRLAGFCVVVLQGIAATARAGWDAHELHCVASDALRHIVGRAPGGRARTLTSMDASAKDEK